MNKKVEGTIQLDGLIEGKLGDIEDAEERLRDWIASAGAERLSFSLEIQGNSFSILASGDPIAAAALGPDPAGRISGLLRELMNVFPPTGRAGLFSTLRSVEYRPGQEVQTIYLIGPGDVNVQERIIDAETVAAPQAASPREKLRLVLMGLLAAVAVFGISTLFIDYRGTLSRLRDSLRPMSAEMIAVEAGDFAEYFTIEGKEIDRRHEALVLKIKRLDAFPLTDEDVDAAITAAGGSTTKRLALEALLKGYVRCEYYDAKGAYLGHEPLRIKAIAQAGEGEPARVPVGIPSKQPVRKIVLTY